MAKKAVIKLHQRRPRLLYGWRAFFAKATAGELFADKLRRLSSEVQAYDDAER